MHVIDCFCSYYCYWCSIAGNAIITLIRCCVSIKQSPPSLTPILTINWFLKNGRKPQLTGIDDILSTQVPGAGLLDYYNLDRKQLACNGSQLDDGLPGL